MIQVHNEFQIRVNEIEAYLKFIGRVDIDEVALTLKSGAPAYTQAEKDDLARTFRASAFLMFYNLMESTVANAIEAIFDEFDAQGVSYDDCKDNVKLIILGNLKAINRKAAVPLLANLARDIVTRTFRKEEVLSGNVDADLIRDLAKSYGFPHPRVPEVWAKASLRGYPVQLTSGSRLSGNGSSLVTVKNRRNALAHGNDSFATVGRDYTHEDIERIKCEVVAYLDALLQNVEGYLLSKGYRV